MEKIEGIDLPELLSETELEVLEQHRRRVKEIISGIVKDIYIQKRQKIDLERQLKQCTDRILKGEEKYKKIQDGDWSILNDNMVKDKPTSERKEGDNSLLPVPSQR